MTLSTWNFIFAINSTLDKTLLQLNLFCIILDWDRDVQEHLREGLKLNHKESNQTINTNTKSISNDFRVKTLTLEVSSLWDLHQQPTVTIYFSNRFKLLGLKNDDTSQFLKKAPIIKSSNQAPPLRVLEDVLLKFYIKRKNKRFGFRTWIVMRFS